MVTSLSPVARLRPWRRGVQEYFANINYHLGRENNAINTKVTLNCEKLRYDKYIIIRIKTNKNVLPLCLTYKQNDRLNQTRKGNQHIRGKWFIDDTKQCKDNQLQSLELPCRMKISKYLISSSNSALSVGEKNVRMIFSPVAWYHPRCSRLVNKVSLQQIYYIVR